MSSPPTDVQLPATRTRVLVRRALGSDRTAIRSVVAAAYAPYARILGVALFRRYQADLLDLDRHACLGEVLVAELDGVVRGSGTYYPDAADQGVGWPAGWASGRGLAVDPSARGLGVAQALLSAVENRARADRAPVFAFHTAGFMLDAVALYERLGYERAPEFDIDLADLLGATAAAPVPALAYLRRLSDDDVSRAGSALRVESRRHRLRRGGGRVRARRGLDRGTDCG
jgi:GNAT superfamily N-acetyltransferase